MTDRRSGTSDEELNDYCRQIEAYLCGKNEGHLVRIVGPAFEQVSGWAAHGVPLKIAFRGIDRYCERYYAKGPRRRPVRVEFCEADILDLFDDWRRAVGVPAVAAAGDERPARKPPLAAHVARCVARLTAARAGGRGTPALDALLDTTVRELDRLGADAKHARGGERARIVERLAEMDRSLLAAAVEAVDPARAAALKREADAELAPFGSRMAPEERARASGAAFQRLVRESLGLPVLTGE